MAGWTTADLVEKFQMYLGRGVGGTMAADELWTTTRIYTWLADAQEHVFADLAPIVPNAFLILSTGAPTLLTSSDDGVTYQFPADAYPFGHVEVWAQESGGRELYATNYGDPTGDFVIEGGQIRTPGNRTRTYASGPYARYVRMPTRITRLASGTYKEPSIKPDAACELILWKALANAANVSNGTMDDRPWLEKYAEARKRWLTVWQTQYKTQNSGAGRSKLTRWWLNLADNGTL